MITKRQREKKNQQTFDLSGKIEINEKTRQNTENKQLTRKLVKTLNIHKLLIWCENGDLPAWFNDDFLQFLQMVPFGDRNSGLVASNKSDFWTIGLCLQGKCKASQEGEKRPENRTEVLVASLDPDHGLFSVNQEKRENITNWEKKQNDESDLFLKK